MDTMITVIEKAENKYNELIKTLKNATSLSLANGDTLKITSVEKSEEKVRGLNYQNIQKCNEYIVTLENGDRAYATQIIPMLDNGTFTINSREDNTINNTTQESKTNRLETAEMIAEKINGRVWSPKGENGIIRVYLTKGFCQVNDDGVNIDAVCGQLYDEMKQLLNDNNIKNYRR